MFHISIGFKQLNSNLNILILKTKNKISIVNMYINNFFLVLNIMDIFKILKKLLEKKYNIKNLSKIKIIIK